MDLAYEDIISEDRLAGFNRITALLGVSSFTELPATQHIRQNPQHASGLLQNHVEMVSALRGMEDGWMLDS